MATTTITLTITDPHKEIDGWWDCHEDDLMEVRRKMAGKHKFYLESVVLDNIGNRSIQSPFNALLQSGHQFTHLQLCIILASFQGATL